MLFIYKLLFYRAKKSLKIAYKGLICDLFSERAPAITNLEKSICVSCN
jgi:hypothetical protein